MGEGYKKRLSLKPKYQFIVAMLLIIIPLVMVGAFNSGRSFYEKRDQNLFNSSMSSEDFSLCFKIKDKEVKNQCFFELAKKLKKISLCYNLVNVERKGDSIWAQVIGFVSRNNEYNPKDQCLQDVRAVLLNEAMKSLNYSACQDDLECEYQISVKLNDSNSCRNFEASKADSCFSDISKNTKNINLCKLINYTQSKSQCYYFFTSFMNEEALCKLVPQDKASECYYKLAINQSNISYCNLTENKAADCYFNIARSTGHSSYCIRTGEYESQCWEFFALNQSEEEFCRISGNESCYYKLALQTKNPELCRKADKERPICLYWLALEKKEPSLCLEVAELELTKDVCYSSLPYAQAAECRQFDDSISACVYLSSQSTAAYCNYISKEYWKAKCYRNVAVETSNSKMCELAGDFTNNCFFEIAIKGKNVEFCKKAGPWTAECFKKLENATSG